ncbi:MAG: hypothetical protein JXQ90_18335 [Cyclobacteriaceae bacterium]
MKKLFLVIAITSLAITSCKDVNHEGCDGLLLENCDILCTEDCEELGVIKYFILNDLDVEIRLESYGSTFSNEEEFIPNQTESFQLNPSDTSEIWSTSFDAIGDDDSYSIFFSGTGFEGSYPLVTDSISIFINDQLVNKFSRKIDRRNRDSSSIFFWDAYNRIVEGTYMYTLDSITLLLK